MDSVDSAAVISEIVHSLSTIKACRFFLFSTATKLQDRLTERNAIVDNLVSKAQSKKALEKIRFWNALLALFVEEKTHNNQLLSEAFYHQPNRDYSYIGRTDIERFLAETPNSPRAINSKVLMTDGSSRHIPLLDFKVPSKKGHDTLVIDCIKALSLRGYIMDSGKSYHFIGRDLISESDLIDILAKFIFLDPISDKAWAAHQIIERSASLRISKLRGHSPFLVARV